MSERPHVLSIAGFDPSAGAGVLADIKTFEQHKVYGLGICTAMTVQTDAEFFSVEWIEKGKIIYQLEILLNRFKVVACKIGIIPGLVFLRSLTEVIRRYNKNTFIVFDPVLTASTGFEFNKPVPGSVKECFSGIDLITPNYIELKFLQPGNNLDELTKTTAVLLKGGHNPDKKGIDILYYNGMEQEINPFSTEVYSKHGSGCILSSAIAANMAMGSGLPEACIRGKEYTEKILNSNRSLLGWHHL